MKTIYYPKIFNLAPILERETVILLPDYQTVIGVTGSGRILCQKVEGPFPDKLIQSVIIAGAISPEDEEREKSIRNWMQNEFKPTGPLDIYGADDSKKFINSLIKSCYGTICTPVRPHTNFYWFGAEVVFDLQPQALAWCYQHQVNPLPAFRQSWQGFEFVYDPPSIGISKSRYIAATTFELDPNEYSPRTVYIREKSGDGPMYPTP